MQRNLAPQSHDQDECLSSSSMSISVESSPGGQILQTSGNSLTASVLSIRSGDATELLRETHGRSFNAQGAMWILPADSEEHNRLDVQHTILKESLGGLYAAPHLVHQALAPKQNVRPGILDIGTGSGSWAIDMAKEFSHAEVVGIDLAPPAIQGVTTLPGNLRFEIDDANLSLTHYSKCFDVVHCRSIDHGIDDYQGFIYNLAQILRPNGVLLLATGVSKLFDEHLQPLPVVDEGYPGFCSIQNILATIYNLSKSEVTKGPIAHWKEWLEKNPNYTNVGTLLLYLPIGAWQSGMDERARQMAQFNLFNTYKMIHGLRPIILEQGMEQKLVDRWLELATDDLQNGRLRVFSRWEYAWAVRRNTKWKPRFA